MPHWARAGVVIALACSGLIAACDGRTSATADGAVADASLIAADRVSGDGADSADQASDADSAEADVLQTAADRVSGDGANSADQASDADFAEADADADADSAACIILASNYDQSCTVDSDCTGAHMGDYCSVPTSPYGGLLCPQSPISVAALPQYRADVSRTPLGQAILTRMYLGSSCGQAQAPVSRNSFSAFRASMRGSRRGQTGSPSGFRRPKAEVAESPVIGLTPQSTVLVDWSTNLV